MGLMKEYQEYVLKMYGNITDDLYANEIRAALIDHKSFFYFMQTKIVQDFKLQSVQIPHSELVEITKLAQETYDYENNKFSEQIYNALINYII